MKIIQLSYVELNIPFNIGFKHNSATRYRTETIIVKIVNDKGLVGYGEGCPRHYVTGESITTAKQFLDLYRQEMMGLSTLGDLNLFISVNRRIIDQNPAAWCAAELAFLDLLAKDSKQSVESLLGIRRSKNKYSYSAILGHASPEIFHKMYRNYRNHGFNDFKIKLSEDLGTDRDICEIIKKEKSHVTVRADANNLWHTNKQAIEHLSGIGIILSAVEEPLKSTRIHALDSFVEESGVRVILDESFLTIERISDLLHHPEYWIVNLRVSKMGGLIRSLQILEKLVNHKILVNVGAQVGETSLLTRASLILADAAFDNLMAHEGAFSTHLLKMDPFTPNIKFGYGGKLDLSQNSFRDNYGFGLEYISVEI